jgi:hypothetical protein
MPEGRMTNVMTSRDGTNQILVQPQCPRDRLGYRSNVQTMFDTRAQMIVARFDEHLRLMTQATKCTRMDDPRIVTLEGRAELVGL